MTDDVKWLKGKTATPRHSLKATLLLVVLLSGALRLEAQVSWQDRLSRSLPAMGAHNWIVLADPAYPLQNTGDIEVVTTGLSQPDLLTAVLNALAATRHVRPVFYTDAELPFVSESDAHGIGAWRAQLDGMLKGGEVSAVPAAQNESKIEDAAHTYHVLVLKSTTALPYSAVFIELHTGYWNPDAEKRLRNAMQGK